MTATILELSTARSRRLREGSDTLGRFIVLEGIDGSGTTTQLSRLAAVLRDCGLTVLETREPTDRPAGRLLRAALRGEERFPPDALALLFAADRVDHLAGEIVPALARGEVVLCDRYVGSSLIYQAQFSPPAFVRAVNGRARPADLTVVVDVPAELAAQRRAARGGPIELFDENTLQARLARAYRALPTLLPGERVVRVDGTQSPAEVTEAILVHLDALFGEPAEASPVNRPASDQGPRPSQPSPEAGVAEADALLGSLLAPSS